MASPMYSGHANQASFYQSMEEGGVNPHIPYYPLTTNTQFLPPPPQSPLAYYPGTLPHVQTNYFPYDIGYPSEAAVLGFPQHFFHNYGQQPLVGSVMDAQQQYYYHHHQPLPATYLHTGDHGSGYFESPHRPNYEDVLGQMGHLYISPSHLPQHHQASSSQQGSGTQSSSRTDQFMANIPHQLNPEVRKKTWAGKSFRAYLHEFRTKISWLPHSALVQAGKDWASKCELPEEIESKADAIRSLLAFLLEKKLYVNPNVITAFEEYARSLETTTEFLEEKERRIAALKEQQQEKQKQEEEQKQKQKQKQVQKQKDVQKIWRQKRLSFTEGGS